MPRSRPMKITLVRKGWRTYTPNLEAPMRSAKDPLRDRVAAWLSVNPNLPTPDIRFLLEPVPILDAASVSRLIEHLGSNPQKPGLVVLDTLAMHLGDGDENSTQDMSAFCRSVRMIREGIGAAVLVAHHTGWQTKHERGSTAFRGAVDTLIKVTENNGIVTLQCDKQRDDGAFP